MSRQRRRAIIRRLEKMAARDVSSRSMDQLVDDEIEVDRLIDEWRWLAIELLERQPAMSAAEARLYRYYKGMVRT